MMKSMNTRSVVKPSSTAQTPLDLSTVRTNSDHALRTRSRIFGLQEAPTYYPNQKEFADPIKYIQSIRAEAEEYGIVKVVPPKGWNPDFSLDTEVSTLFKFDRLFSLTHHLYMECLLFAIQYNCECQHLHKVPYSMSPFVQYHKPIFFPTLILSLYSREGC
jgi:hypothetical protein